MRIIRTGGIAISPMEDIAWYYVDMGTNGSILGVKWGVSPKVKVMSHIRAIAAREALQAVCKSGPQEVRIVTECPSVLGIFTKDVTSFARLNTLYIEISQLYESLPKPRPTIGFDIYTHTFRAHIASVIRGEFGV